MTSSEASPGSTRVFVTRISGIGDPNLIGVGMGSCGGRWRLVEDLNGSVLDNLHDPPPTSTTFRRRRPVRPEGLEPPRVAPPAPKAGASANSATVANFREMYTFPVPGVVSLRLRSHSHVPPPCHPTDCRGRCLRRTRDAGGSPSLG